MEILIKSIAEFLWKIYYSVSKKYEDAKGAQASLVLALIGFAVFLFLCGMALMI